MNLWNFSTTKKENRKAPQALGQEDFDKIRNLEIPASGVSLNITRDLFLFSCYTGVHMECISKMMGHTIIRTTQGYTKVTDDRILEDMDRLMEKRKQQELTNNNAFARSDRITTTNTGAGYLNCIHTDDLGRNRKLIL